MPEIGPIPPGRVFVIVVETEGSRDPDRMPLLKRDENGRQLTPAFTTMERATRFLSRAQELGYFVKLDYIFPADGPRLAGDFPDHQFELDPEAEAFFREAPQAQ